MILRSGGMLLVALLATGCAVSPASDGPVSPVVAAHTGAPAAAQPESPELPAVNLSGELLYQVLLGEIAANRGHPDTAANALLSAAHSTRDPRLAQRAARLALAAEKLDTALEAASLWVELAPDETQPRESLALILAEQGRIDASAEGFIGVLKEGDGPGAADLRRSARLLGQLSNDSTALAVMERIVARFDEQPEAWFAKAFLADRLGRDTLVLEALDRALALRPDWQEAALAKLGKLIQNHYPREEVAAFAVAFLDSYPDATRVRISYARYLVDEGASQAALAQFEQVLASEPDNSTALISAALLSMQEERYANAIGYLKQHLELTPDNDQIRLYLGQIAEQQERYADAERWYRAVTSEAQQFDARLALGTVIQEQQGLDAAMAHLATIIPTDEDEFTRLALTRELVLRKADHLTRAKSVLDEAVAQYPDNNELRYARGLLAARLNQIAELENDMRRLLEENPNNAHALNALGYTLADATDRLEEAYELVSKALEMRPEDPFILDSMGWVQYRLGNHQDAIDYLERALSQRDDAEIAAHLGEVLWVTGERQRARTIWSRAQSEDPDNHVLNETIERLTR